MLPARTDGEGGCPWAWRDAGWVVLSLLVMAVALERLGRVSADQLAVPFDANYETPAQSTISVIREGGNPYDPQVYARPPFILTMYTPLYPYVVAALPQRADNPFFTGRVVSGLCMLAAAAVLFAVGGRRARWLLPGLGAACFCLLWPVTQKTAFVRCDPMALMFAAWAVAIAARARPGAPSRGVVLGAAGLCCLAVAAKQSYVAAVPACLLGLWGAGRRPALFFVLAFAGGMALLAVAASWLWGPGFWFSTVSASANPFNPERAWLNLTTMLRQPVFCWLLATGLLVAWRRLRQRGSAALRADPYLAYVLFAWIVLLLTFAKRGSFTNYFLEPALALCMLLVACWRDRPLAWFRRGLPLAAFAALLGCVGLELAQGKSADYAHVDPARRRAKEAFYADMNARIARLAPGRPRVLNVYKSIHTFSLGQRPFLNDSILYQFAWNDGKLDVMPLIEVVRRGEFDVVLLPTDVEGLDPASPLGRVTRALLDTYRAVDRANTYLYLVRR